MSRPPPRCCLRFRPGQARWPCVHQPTKEGVPGGTPLRSLGPTLTRAPRGIRSTLPDNSTGSSPGQYDVGNRPHPGTQRKSLMIATSYPLLDALLTMLWLFLFIIWIWLLILVFSEIFRRRDLSG